MVRKKIDNRVRILIENCVSTHHRSLFVVVGEKARDSVVILHEMLSKAEVKARPTVLWCYKSDLGFSTNKKKRRRLKSALSGQGKQVLDENDSIEYFIASTNIRYCYYRETRSILGQTFGMAILQDFEALTPNLLARTVETVEGGGMILILLQSLTSLKQLYTMAMDVHARYRTETHQSVVCRFNERFILSLPTCSNCLVLDDKLNILPISSNALSIKTLPPKSRDEPQTPEERELQLLKSSLDSSQPADVLIKMCKTLDQAKAVTKFVDSLTEMTLRSTVTLTAARGRGKSAALGLAVAAAIAFKYTNISVASPHPENLKTFFKFLLDGLNALGYEKTTDYEEVRSMNPEFNKAIVQVNVMRKHRQTVKYVQPSSEAKLGLVELLVIDEAAAIPLPFIKALMGPYLIFLASTVNGYEGTGRSLSLKLIAQLRKESINNNTLTSGQQSKSLTGRILHELTLDESIRYGPRDQVENWLNHLLCLDVIIPPVALPKFPSLNDCKLYYINRDTLFSCNKYAERFLRRLIAILVASHYQNSPNDLLIMSDAPAHHLFCLCSPSSKTLPEIICVLQICLEGKLSENIVKQELSRGKRYEGDIIPWSISQEYSEEDFPALSGARIVKIATHPDYQNRGYGTLALKLLQEFYEGKYNTSENLPTVSALNNMTSLPIKDEDDEEIESMLKERLQPRMSLPPLLYEMNQIKPDILDYIGVSYGLSEELLRFWKKSDFSPVYLNYTPNQLTGDHSCIMLKQLNGISTSSKWLPTFWYRFCEKIVHTLQFLKLGASLGFSLISKNLLPSEIFIDNFTFVPDLSKQEVLCHLTPDDLDTLKEFNSKTSFINIPNHIIHSLSQFYFSHRMRNVRLTDSEALILFAHGLLFIPFENVAENQENVLKEFKSGFTKISNYILSLDQ
nr:RNA cytidine acetyltransferase [Parasteatoda tepidariorum]